ncbi:hypothetical protein O181_021157 [Austropuccinia psidii MF-1]|uniref:Uncharacterized protein n=1 Tax=Austropuccinia psidii MF-1 TaxID=1389203 RepID=A0A9Q3CEY5_9BASI|nr:hypothetical protein [Austropuccinia psidii MF-1]
MGDSFLSNHSFGSEEVYRVKWCWTLPNLVAVGTSNSLQVLQLDQSYASTVVVNFRLGTRVTQINWGPTMSSDDGSNVKLHIELLVACADQKLRLLSYQASQGDTPAKSTSRIFGQGHSGHSGRITSIAWCSVPGYANVVASAATDKCVLIWNLDTTDSTAQNAELTPPAPTLIGPFKLTPLTISFHPTSSSRLMMHDTSGTIKLIDWTKPNHPILIYLIEPRTLINKLHSHNAGGERIGMAEWKINEADVFGALTGNRWAIWDLRSMRAGTPMAVGDAWGPGVVADVFRWCPTNPRLFALSTSSPNASTSGIGAVQVYSTSFLHSPRATQLPAYLVPSRSRVHDIEWQPMNSDADVLCIAVGRQLIWMRLGMREM